MRATRRTQPYRRRAARMPGPVLDMMLRGHAPGQPNPISQANQLSHMLALLRKRRRRG